MTYFSKMVEVSNNWLTISPKLLQGIDVSNSIEDSKYSLLLNHLFNAIEERIDNPFTDSELKKLQTSLKLPEDKLKLVLSSLAYITKRSTCFIMKPTVLQEELTEKLKFDNSKAETFVKRWTEATKANFDNLQERKNLEKMSWELNLEISSDCSLKKAVPMTVLQLHVKDGEGNPEKVTVEMNEEQLLELYNQMENIQSVLDSLSK